MEDDIHEPDPAESREVPTPIVLRGEEGKGGVLFILPPVEIDFKTEAGMRKGLITGIHKVDVCIIEMAGKIFFRKLHKLEVDNGRPIVVETLHPEKKTPKRSLPGCATIGAVIVAAAGAVLAAQGCGPHSQTPKLQHVSPDTAQVVRP